MAITREQVVTGTYDQAAGIPYEVTATWGSATTAGNLLVAAVGFSLIPSGGTGVTPPSGWTLLGRVDNATNGAVVLYSIEDASSRSGGETFDLDVARDAVVHLAEYSTDADTISLDLAGSGATGTSTSPSTGAVTPTASADLLRVAVLLNRNSNVQSAPTGGFSLVTQSLSPNASAANQMSVGLYQQAHTSGAAATCSATISQSRPWAGLQAVFTEESASNAAPTVNAGADQIASGGGQAVNLSATFGDADGTATVAWTQVSGTTADLTDNGDGTAVVISPALKPVDGSDTLTFRATATDDDGATATDDMQVAVAVHAQWWIDVDGDGLLHPRYLRTV